jgi:phospholipase C
MRCEAARKARPGTAEEASTVAAHGRSFRGRAGAIGLLATAATVLSGLAMSTPASGAPTSPIKHIVVLYLENHSFDSLLGFWCDSHPGRCPDGGMPSSVALSNHAVVTPKVEPDIVPNVSHTVQSQDAAIDGGKMDGWQKVPGCQPKTGYACIGGYTPAQLPNLARLASAFAISDRTFSMANSPSWGGHLYAVMGQLDGFEGQNPVVAPGVTPGPGWGCDSDRITPWQAPGGAIKMVPSCVPDFALKLANGGAFRATPVKYAPTILDRLQGAGLSWRIYGEPTPPTTGSPTAAGYGWDICPSFAECLDTGQKASNVPSATFLRAARTGHLPNFALVTPGGKDAAFSEHNGFSMTAGDDWLGQVAAAVMKGPEWRSTALFITWDDCGCFYDQVPPGVNPDGTPQGPRSPLLIVSPYAKPGFTDTTATTFAGILAYAEHTFGLTALGVNDGKAYAFGHAFNYNQAPLPPVRMVNRPWPADAYHVNLKEADQDT